MDRAIHNGWLGSIFIHMQKRTKRILIIAWGYIYLKAF